MTVAEAQPEAQRVYGLNPTQRFIGLVGDRVMYWNPVLPSGVEFFDKGQPEKRYRIDIPNNREMWMVRDWHVEDVESAYPGEKPGEIWLEVYWQPKGYTESRIAMRKVEVKDAKPMPPLNRKP